MRTILSILMLAAVVAGFALFIVPRYKEISVLRAQAADYNQVLANAATLQSERNQLVTKYNAFDPNNLAKLGIMLPNNPESVKVILSLDAAARQYGMSLQNVKIQDPTTATTAGTAPGTTAQNADMGTLNITFALSGPYAGFTQFLQTIQQSLRIIDVNKLTFAAVDSTPNYQYTVGIQTYWLK